MPSSSTVSYYVGLLTGGNTTSTPASTATLGNFDSGFAEMNGSGYERIAVTFNSPTIATAYNASSPLLTTTLSANASEGNWYVNLTSATGLLAGMTIVIGTEDPKVIAATTGTEVILTSPLASNQSSGATVTAGDAVSGKRAAGQPVTFLATGTWTAATGYFITDSASGNSGNIYYFSNFADGSSPTLGANDTLQVTPTWLLSN